ncbi:hypothetical protein AVEN_219979-1 [Araneus ventricosus]|uniref:Uncharacterized protein n=1 Tax=Araneus ventricosus TaxID=182803 RepID=A0A4Y2E5L8_ARAVE|nr:hypothetical protein AVEN_239826-1 [Araneus ventricosus]GBM23215.1 hypothetical protein AVEN_219979-1 [Araneus ventricosus]
MRERKNTLPRVPHGWGEKAILWSGLHFPSLRLGIGTTQLLSTYFKPWSFLRQFAANHLSYTNRLHPPTRDMLYTLWVSRIGVDNKKNWACAPGLWWNRASNLDPEAETLPPGHCGPLIYRSNLRKQFNYNRLLFPL